MFRRGNADFIIWDGISKPSKPPSVAGSIISSVAKYGRLHMIKSNFFENTSAALQQILFPIGVDCFLKELMLMSVPITRLKEFERIFAKNPEPVPMSSAISPFSFSMWSAKKNVSSAGCYGSDAANLFCKFDNFIVIHVL